MKMLFAFILTTMTALSAHGQLNPAGAPIPWAPMQFLNGSGALAVSGKLCSYSAGTDTPLETYTTNDLSIANSNPMTLSSSGRPQTNGIFLSAVSYKFSLYSPLATGATCPLTGAIVWTVDGVFDMTQLVRAGLLWFYDDDLRVKFRESDQTLPVGLWGLHFNGGSMAVEKTTSGDFDG